MKYLFLAAFCAAITGCSSGGDVVGNGLTGTPSRTQVIDSGGMEPAKSCGCSKENSCTEGGNSCSENKSGAPNAETDCGCGHPEHHHKAKKKAK